MMSGLMSSDGCQGPSRLEFNCRLPTGSHTELDTLAQWVHMTHCIMIMELYERARAFHSSKAHELPNTSRRKLTILLLEIQTFIILPRSKTARQTALFSITNHKVSGGAYQTSLNVCFCACMCVCARACVYVCVRTSLTHCAPAAGKNDEIPADNELLMTSRSERNTHLISALCANPYL